MYAASGLSKLLDRDWFGGTVTWHRVVLLRHRLDDSALPGWAVAVLTDRSFHTVAAKVIVATELFIALGLCWRATRLAAVWVAVCFHVSIQLSASVQVFSFLAIAALVIWAVPSTRDRVLAIDVTDGRARRFVAVVRALDWLARFRLDRGPAGIRATSGGSRRCRLRWPTGRVVHLEPAADDGMVRPAGAAPAEADARRHRAPAAVSTASADRRA